MNTTMSGGDCLTEQAPAILIPNNDEHFGIETRNGHRIDCLSLGWLALISGTAVGVVGIATELIKEYQATGGWLALGGLAVGAVGRVMVHFGEPS